MKHQKKILLVYPEVPKNTYWSFQYALKFIDKKSAMPPLGLITIATYFPDTYDLKLVDMNIEPLLDEDIQWADAVFVSAMIIQQESLREVIEICNTSGKTVVAGGPYPTSSYAEISGVDHFVLGEVEDVFGEFLSDFENGRAKSVYLPAERPDMEFSPVPRYDLLNRNAYSSMSIQYSRGCPFKCEFCDIWKVLGNKPRLKPTKTMIAELEALYELGWHGAVFMVDDNFIGNKRRVKKELLPALIEWQREHGYVFRFYTEASINMADDDELLSMMRDAGFNEVFIGIETPSMDSLKETGKVQNVKTDMRSAIRHIQGYGIEVMAGFILGFDSDTDDIADRQIEFIQETGIVQAMVGLLTALPGTDLYERLSGEGRILNTTTGNNTHGDMTNFVTRMDPGKLKQRYHQVLSAIYDANMKNYFARCSRMLENIGKTPFYSRKVHIAELVMLFKSLFLQPFTPYGYQYLKFICKHFFQNPHYFPEAIKFSIIGHHFHTITQQMIEIEKVSSYLDESYVYMCEQINKYSAAIDNSREVLRNSAALWKRKKEILGKTRRKIDSIHIDFRHDITEKYSEISKKMQELFENFEQDLKRNGIKVQLFTS